MVDDAQDIASDTDERVSESDGIHAAVTAPTSGNGSSRGPGGVGADGARPAPQIRRSASALVTWGIAAAVLVIVIVLIIVKITGTTPASTPDVEPPAQTAPASVVQDVTHVPASVYDAVGVSSPDALVTPPKLLHGEAALSYTGKPGVLFVGGEFCPYCAAQRWAFVTALSRFGKWSDLETMTSGPDEAFPQTPTFTFAHAKYTSRYIGVVLREQYGSQENGSGTAYSLLRALSPAQRSLLDKYDRLTSAAAGQVLPFVDIDNRAIVIGADYSPSILQQLTATQIAAGMTDPKDPATQAIVASANYLSASICSADGERPTSVCTSKGVIAAATALGAGGS